MAVIRLDKISAQNVVSLQAPSVLTNGLFLQLGGLVEGETELRKATAPTDVKLGGIVLHATPEVDPDPRKTGLKHFEVASGAEGRGIYMTVGDIITLTKDLITGTVAVDKTLIPANGAMKLSVDELNANAEGATLKFRVIEKTTLGYDAQEAYALEVVSI